MIIKPEQPQDADAIRDLVARAFADAPHRSGTEPAIVDALRSALALTISLVAIEAAALVGHVAVSPVETENADAGWFGLGPVSVLPAMQRQGIGSALIGRAISQLRESGAAGCVVLGDPAYYGRFGFRHDPAASYRDVPPPWFQVLPLAGACPVGAIEYHPAFEAAG